MPTIGAAKPQVTKEQWLEQMLFITREYLFNNTSLNDLVTSLES